jgi:hypothetical protein
MFCDNDQEWLDEVNDHLKTIADRTEAPPPWYATWKSLGPNPTIEQRVQFYQAMRDADDSLSDIAFNLIATEIGKSADKVFGKRFKLRWRFLGAIVTAKSLGMEGPPLPPQEDIDELQRDLEDGYNQLLVQCLEASGEFAMARMYIDDPEGFERKLEKGWIERAYADAYYVWIPDLCRAVETCLDADFAGVQCEYRIDTTDDGFAEIMIFPEFFESYGGKLDGAACKLKASFDLSKLRELFTDVLCFEQDTMPSKFGDIAVVEIWGSFQGNYAEVHVLERAPDDASPSLKVPCF